MAKNVQASREGLASLTVWINPEVKKELKRASVEHEVTVQELVETILAEALPSAGKFARRIRQAREQGINR